ncbi:MAG: DNA polymerase III subunit epsilon [Rhodospirillales bacterium]|nr:DNA polymerase III subunit epsilon [Rhodospirillales bacterium]
MREVVLDTETTGLDLGAGHRLVEIGCVELVNLIPTGKTWQTYLNPQRGNEREAYNVHGLSDGYLARQPLFRDKAQDLLDFLADSRLVIHNAEFDLTFLNNELRMEGMEPISGERVTCSLELARKIYPGQANSLDALMKRLGVDDSARTRHGALLDAELLAQVYLELKGGRQADFAFANQARAPGYGSRDASRPRVRREPRSHEATPEEKARHKAYLHKNVPNSIWFRDKFAHLMR